MFGKNQSPKTVKKKQNDEWQYRGVKFLKQYQSGKQLTHKEAILAKCAECMKCYADGKTDCLCPTCPLYPFAPYRQNQF